MSSGISPTSSYIKLDNTTSSATSYKNGIDGNSVGAERIAANFLPYGSTGMFINVMPGHVFDGVNLTEVSAQTSSALTAPISNSRIDRIVVTKSSGGLLVVTGTPGVSPVAPAIPSGYIPVAQVLLSTATTALGNATVTDERDLSQLGGSVGQLLNYAVDTGSANAYAVAPSPAISAYAAGQMVILKPTHNQTAASTLSVSGLSTKNIKTLTGADPDSGMMTTSGTYILIYDGTNFVLQDPSILAANSVTLSMLATQAANTVLANQSSAAAVPSAIALSASQLMGRGSSNIIPIPLDSTLTINGSSNLAVNVGTSSGQVVQLGVGAKLPAVDGSQLTNVPSAYVLLSKQSVSGAASMDFGSSLFTTGYSRYDFVLENVTGSSLTTLFKLSMLSASSAQAVSYYRQIINLSAFTVTSSGVGSSNAIISNNSGAMSGKISLVNTSSSLSLAMFNSVMLSGTNICKSDGSGNGAGVGSVNIKILPDAGTITGTGELWGAKNT